MKRNWSVLLLFFMLVSELDAKAEKAKEIQISQEGFCFIRKDTVGKRKQKKYMFASDDGIIYEIRNPRYLKSYAGKEVVLEGIAKKTQLKDDLFINVVKPKSLSLIVCGKIKAKKNKKSKRWLCKIETVDGAVYTLTTNSKSSFIARKFNGKELRLWGKLRVKKLKDRAIRKYIEVTGYDGEILRASRSSKKKNDKVFAETAKKLPAEELKPGATVTIPLPELGNSASSKDLKPIEMTVFLPGNYVADQKHPVIVHMSGGFGSSKGAGGWRRVVGNDNFILLGADYSHKANKEKDLLKLGTCRDFDYKIAAHCLQILKNSTDIDEKTIILAGLSSGGYSITYSLGCDNTELFAGFCPIIGGTDRCGNADIGERSILFVAGENDTQYDRVGDTKKAVAALKKKNHNVRLHIQKGVGHSWSADAHPVQRKWLFAEFTNLAKYERWRDLAENSECPDVKKYFSDKIEKSWFKYPVN